MKHWTIYEPEHACWIFGTGRHDKLKKWLEDNGIDPAVVPLDEEVWIEDWKNIHIVECKYKHGYRYEDKETGDVAKESFVVPMTTMPPEDMYGIVKEV